MAQQTEHGGQRLPHVCMTRSLVDHIVLFGVPTYEIGLLAALRGLCTLEGGAMGEKWAWDREALAKLPDETLSRLLEGLNSMVVVQ